MLNIFDHFKRKVDVTFPDGTLQTLDIPDESSYRLYRKSRWEPDVTYFMKKHVKGDVIEIGAHIGFHTIILSKLVGDSGRVFAFEPSPKTYSCLQKNTKSYRNIITYQEAVTDGKVSELILRNYFGWSAWNTVLTEGRFVKKENPSLRKIFSQNVKVKATSLDNFLENHKDVRPQFIKIDAENAEMQILNGFTKGIVKFKPKIVFEGGDLNRPKGELTLDIITRLQSLNYEIMEYDKEKSAIIPHEPRSSYPDWVNFLAINREG